MRAVLLDKLPRLGEKKIDWRNSVGHEVPFVYDTVVGFVKIVKIVFNGNLVKGIVTQYKDNVRTLDLRSFKECNFKSLIFNNRKEVKNYGVHSYRKGQRLLDESRDIYLMKESTKLYANKYTITGFEYKCLCCGYVGFKTISSINKGTGCKNKCKNKKQ